MVEEILLRMVCPEIVATGMRVCLTRMAGSRTGQLDELTILVTAERIWARAALMKQGDILGPGTDPRLPHDVFRS